jgi:cytochrome P450
MELRVVFEEVLRRMPDLEYAGDGPVLQPSSMVRCCVEMQVRFTPEGEVADAA